MMELEKFIMMIDFLIMLKLFYKLEEIILELLNIYL